MGLELKTLNYWVVKEICENVATSNTTESLFGHFCFDFETPIELECFDLQKHKVFDYLFKPMSQNIRFLIAFVEKVINNSVDAIFRKHF